MLVESIKEYEHSIDFALDDRGHDALRKAKYIIANRNIFTFYLLAEDLNTRLLTQREKILSAPVKILDDLLSNDALEARDRFPRSRALDRRSEQI